MGPYIFYVTDPGTGDITVPVAAAKINGTTYDLPTAADDGRIFSVILRSTTRDLREEFRGSFTFPTITRIAANVESGSSGAGVPVDFNNDVVQVSIGLLDGDAALIATALQPAAIGVTVEGFVSLTANQRIVESGAGRVARTEKQAVCWSANITADGLYPGPVWPNFPITLSEVTLKTTGGACDVQVKLNGSGNLNGFTSAQGASSTAADVASTQALVEDDDIDFDVTNATALVNLKVTFKGVRTGN